jgi:hypothetical protein
MYTYYLLQMTITCDNKLCTRGPHGGKVFDGYQIRRSLPAAKLARCPEKLMGIKAAHFELKSLKRQSQVDKENAPPLVLCSGCLRYAGRELATGSTPERGDRKREHTRREREREREYSEDKENIPPPKLCHDCYAHCIEPVNNSASIIFSRR